MSITLAPRLGWERTLVIANNSLELVVTLDVGPRIISCRHPDGENILKTMDAQLGGKGEKAWQIRGGHRLWVAPESAMTYYPDNEPVSFDADGELRVRLTSPPEQANGLAKAMEITLDRQLAEVTIDHTITALTDFDSPIAAWGLTVLKPGGKAVVPMPVLSLHPNDKDNQLAEPADYLPNRNLSLWPYTDMNDSRFTWREDAFLVRQDATFTSTKIGFLHQGGPVRYEVDGICFSKKISYQQGADYPDAHCNLEIFTNGEFLELESLSPLTSLKAGEQILHREVWTLGSVASD